jgi:ParB-like chromosome segregation protein Spo0J
MSEAAVKATQAASTQAASTADKATVDWTSRDRQFHPLADIFPLMEGPEFDALVEDIKTNGLREPITLYEGKILDGRNRYRAIVKAGLLSKLKEEHFRQFDPKTQGDPLAFVISANLHRRHLNETQRALIAANLVTTKLGDNQHKSGSITMEKAAKVLSVGEATIKRAKTVIDKGAPEIVEALQKGKLRLGMAVGVVEKPKEQQAQAVKDAKEAIKAKAKATREAAKPDNKETSEHNQRMVELDTFKKKWEGFNDMQQRSFVETYRNGLQTILQKIAEHEAYQHAAE